MNLKEFTKNIEKPIYKNLEELYDIAELNFIEREIFNKYKKECEYWLLRSKKQFSENINDSTNFIKNLAQVLINLQSPKVTGQKNNLIKEMFGDKKVHRCYETKNGLRSTINSNKIFNTYFELRIMSFFLENNFDIKLSNSKEKGIKIPEFVASKKEFHLNVEAKQLDVDKIMDHIFGSIFINGIGYKYTKHERERGYEAIKATVKRNYDNALQKFDVIPKNEYFILFFSANYSISVMGKAVVDYLNNISSEWKNSKYNNLLGIIVEDQDNTYFFRNDNSNLNLENYLSGISNFHTYTPSAT